MHEPTVKSGPLHWLQQIYFGLCRVMKWLRRCGFQLNARFSFLSRRSCYQHISLSCDTAVVELLKEAGLPYGAVNPVNGTAETVNALIDHPDVKAVTFAGTSHIAEIIARRCHKLNKRVLALGSSKNHTISAPDCNIGMTSTDIVESFTGCSGESYMSPTVLLSIRHQQDLMDKIVAKSEALRPGSLDGQMGPVIDQAALDNITRYINAAEVNAAEASGARILVDGRCWTKSQQEGYWIGPTMILHTNKQDAALHEEDFGPVLSILKVETAEEAIAFENANPYGNGAGIYTSSGATADFFIRRFNAGMCGINVGSLCIKRALLFWRLE